MERRVVEISVTYLVPSLVEKPVSSAPFLRKNSLDFSERDVRGE